MPRHRLAMRPAHVLQVDQELARVAALWRAAELNNNLADAELHAATLDRLLKQRHALTT